MTFVMPFCMVSQLCITVCNPLQDSILSQSAVTTGVAASRGEVEKDVHHEEVVLGAGGIFIPLAVETRGGSKGESKGSIDPPSRITSGKSKE